ncbi:5'-3' DNA helicase ZGRF1-like [Amphiura filiformis]|uniref:5'-3' DNA helicase ZGRF1-like n=1 Tax=Amphiura filiformis TaxID=82378 RepID=UPI003B21EE53
MAGQEFEILYTHQKTKKSKTWQDGVLKVSVHGNRAVLYDVDNTRLDALHIKPDQAQSLIGVQLESDKYLITVEEKKTTGASSDSENSKPRCNMTQQQPVSLVQHAKPMQGLALRQPLKRRRTGFTVPRQVIKKPAPDLQSQSSITGSKIPPNAPQTAKPSLFNTPFSTNSSNSHRSFFNMYGNSNKPLPVDLQSNFQTDVSNVQSNCNIAKEHAQIGEQPCVTSLDPVDRTEDLEESFEPLCFDVATPSSSTVESQFTEFNNDETRDPQDSIDIQQKNNASSNAQSQDVVQTNNNDQAHYNEMGTSKRSASQILALLGRSNGKFKPPVKESAVSSQGGGMETLMRKRTDDAKTQEMSLSGNSQRICSRQVSSSSTHSSFSQSNVDFSHKCGVGSNVSDAQQTADVSIVSSVHRKNYSTGGIQMNASNQRRNAGVASSQQAEIGQEDSSSAYQKSTEQRLDAGVRGGIRISGSSHSGVSSSVQKRPVTSHSNSNNMVSQSSRGFVHPVKTVALRMAKGFQAPTLSTQGHLQRNVCGEFFFPSSEEVKDCAVPHRQVRIPVFFPNVAMYKQVMIGAMKEHLNIILFKLAQQYHSALSKVDLAGYTGATGSCTTGDQSSSTSGSPACEHGAPTKMVCVKKEGPNKGRFFYVCSSPRGNQCKFFMWADKHKPQSSNASNQLGNSNQSNCRGLVLSDPGSITSYFKSHHVSLYCQCELLKKSMNSYNSLPGVPAWVRKYKQHQHQDSGKKKLYLKLSHKGPSSTYAKDDLWVISSEMTFEPSCTFLAKSIYHGPSSDNQIEIEPVSGYSPSNWSSSVMVHGLHVGNASNELTCISNIQEHINTRTLPIIPYILNGDVMVHGLHVGNASNELTCISNIQEHINTRTLPIIPYILNGNEHEDPETISSTQAGGFRPPCFNQTSARTLNCSQQQVIHLAEEMILKFGLNPDQGEAVHRVAAMFSNDADDKPITLIHGVFGAGKSFLLAVTVLFLIQLFELSDKNNEDAGTDGSHSEWKLLIASTTNVAVDRILLGLLELGFEEFIRVGSVRKIAKPVLPYSVHAADKEKQELKELQEMLKTDLTPCEKLLVRKSIERHRLGKNKELLSQVRVVGVTCAACTFPSLSCLKFPVVLLDECSQMTEPASLLPIARFECEKLVLVGDPKQLDPTVQGSEPAHNASLEQTLFDRLLLMGYKPILLRTQYRCHPRISAISSSLFYDKQLIDGVSEEDRPKLIDGFPTLCIYNVSNGQEVCASDGSFYNDQEATLVVFMIETLLVSEIQPSDIGVITLYKAQMRKIHQMLLSSGIDKASEMKSIQISTVDAFQGGEKGIIILSSVRTDYMGFADSDKRTNVALTRAKNHLLIAGNLKILTENSLWGQVVEKCQEYHDGIQSAQAFTRQWKDKIAEIQQAQQEMAASQKKSSRKKMTAVSESDQRKAKRKKMSPCKQAKTVVEPGIEEAFDDADETNMPGFVKSSALREHIAFSDDDFEDDSLVPADDPTTTQKSSLQSNSSPSYSPLEHVVPSDSGSDSDEELPSFNIGDL